MDLIIFFFFRAQKSKEIYNYVFLCGPYNLLMEKEKEKESKGKGKKKRKDEFMNVFN